MRYCENCGNKLRDNTKFCGKCGCKVETEDAREILCPYCNANLLDQEDFDEDDEFYECKKCKSVWHNGDWFCENCNSNLSIQEGFAGMDWEFFECKKCGKIFYNAEFTCPYCHDVLNVQKNFNPKYNYHVCEKCGEDIYSSRLYSGERFPDTYWKCDKCNALLNAQRGFSDLNDNWQCRKCGFINTINLDEIKNDEKESPKIEKNYEKKCPKCGQILNSFVTYCPCCNYEIREEYISDSMREFTNKIINCKSEKEKITLINSFPVPNTKEDVFEFLLFASSNFDENFYVLHLNETDISDAWLSKIELCYQKGKMLKLDDADNTKIDELYYRVHNRIINAKNNLKLNLNEPNKPLIKDSKNTLAK